MKKYIANKAFYIAALSVAIPMMLQNLVTSSVNLIDSLMVGQLGDVAIGGVAAVNRFYVIGIFAIQGLVASVGIFIAQFFGAHEEEQMKQSFRYSLIASYCVILPLFILAYFFSYQIVSFFTPDPLIIQAGIEYIKMACFSFLPLGVSFSIAGAMRSVGETKIPLYCSVVSVLTNAILNYCLIFGHFGFPEMGVVGAALATAIARFVEMGLLMFALARNTFPFETRIADLFHVPSVLIKDITKKALPLVTNEVLWSGGMAMILKLYGTRGSEVLSGYSICGTATDLFFTLFSGMAVATTVMVAQRLGANKLEEAKANGYHMLGLAFMISLVFAFMIFGVSFVIPSLFTSVSATALEIATNMIRVQAVFFILYTLNTQNYFIVRAGGDTRSTLIMDSGFMWLINIPFLAFLAYYTDINIYLMYMLAQCTDMLKLAVSFWFVKKEKWVVNLTKSKELNLEA